MLCIEQYGRLRFVHGVQERQSYASKVYMLLCHNSSCRHEKEPAYARRMDRRIANPNLRHLHLKTQCLRQVILDMGHRQPEHRRR